MFGVRMAALERFVCSTVAARAAGEDVDRRLLERLRDIYALEATRETTWRERQVCKQVSRLATKCVALLEASVHEQPPNRP